MKNTNRILTSTIATGMSLSFSALANETDLENNLVLENLDTDSINTMPKGSDVGYQSEGGLLNSGMCCADCRDLDIEF